MHDPRDTPTQNSEPAAAAAGPVAGLEFKAGLLLAFTALLVVGAALFLLYARGAFEATQSLVLTTDDSEGVVAGMDMTFSGFPIGRVRRVELADSGNVNIVVDVAQKDAHWLRTTSVFTLVRGIVGGPSIRADTVDTELAEILKAGGLRTFTVASDAPSERLRRWLKKGITTEDLLKTAQISRDLGFSGLKVYMMIGLGPENDDDITELISFTKELSQINRIALGISPFVPKRHTPHFADPFAGVQTIEKRLKRIQKERLSTCIM